MYAAEEGRWKHRFGEDAPLHLPTPAVPCCMTLINNLDNLIKADAPIKDLQFVAKQINAARVPKEKRSGVVGPTTPQVVGTPKTGSDGQCARQRLTPARKDACSMDKQCKIV